MILCASEFVYANTYVCICIYVCVFVLASWKNYDVFLLYNTHTFVRLHGYLYVSCHHMRLTLISSLFVYFFPPECSYWMGKKCVRVSSFGSLFHFRKEQKPADAADRCLDCTCKDEMLNACWRCVNARVVVLLVRIKV